MSQVQVLRSSRGLLHPGLVAAGSTLLIATFVSDFLYWRTLLFQWNNVSEWLLATGLILAALAAIAFVIDLVASMRDTVALDNSSRRGGKVNLGGLSLVPSTDARRGPRVHDHKGRSP